MRKNQTSPPQESRPNQSFNLASKIAGRYGSWVFEIQGIMCLSVAANILTTGFADANRQVEYLAFAVAFWFSAGALALYCTKVIRECEASWDPSSESKLAKHISDRIDQLSKTQLFIYLVHAFIVAAFVFTFLWSSTAATAPATTIRNCYRICIRC